MEASWVVFPVAWKNVTGKFTSPNAEGLHEVLLRSINIEDLTGNMRVYNSFKHLAYTGLVPLTGVAVHRCVNNLLILSPKLTSCTGEEKDWGYYIMEVPYIDTKEEAIDFGTVEAKFHPLGSVCTIRNMLGELASVTDWHYSGCLVRNYNSDTYMMEHSELLIDRDEVPTRVSQLLSYFKSDPGALVFSQLDYDSSTDPQYLTHILGSNNVMMSLGMEERDENASTVVSVGSTLAPDEKEERIRFLDVLKEINFRSILHNEITYTFHVVDK